MNDGGANGRSQFERLTPRSGIDDLRFFTRLFYSISRLLTYSLERLSLRALSNAYDVLSQLRQFAS